MVNVWYARSCYTSLFLLFFGTTCTIPSPLGYHLLILRLGVQFGSFAYGFLKPMADLIANGGLCPHGGKNIVCLATKTGEIMVKRAKKMSHKCLTCVIQRSQYKSRASTSRICGNRYFFIISRKGKKRHFPNSGP